MRNTLTRRSLALLVASFAGACATPTESQETATTSQAIINGTVDSAGLFPGVVSIHYDNGDKTPLVCSGALVSPRYVLTAAHCFTAAGPSNAGRGNFVIRFGWDSKDTSGLFVKHTEAISGRVKLREYVDEYPTAWHVAHDLALVRLDTYVDAPGSTVAIRSVTAYPGDETGTGWFDVGFGPTSETSSVRKRTYANPQSIVWVGTDSKNILHYEKPSGETYFGGTNGDSGGPLLRLEDGKPVMVGVMSGGIPGESTYWAPVSRNDNDAWIRDIILNADGSYRDNSDDFDGDLIPDYRDNCPTRPNPRQENSNFASEYQLTCSGTVCDPAEGAPPPDASSTAAIDLWHSRYKGDTCDTNGTPRLSLNDMPPIAAGTSGCTNYYDRWSYRIPYTGACYYQKQNDQLINDGVVGHPLDEVAPLAGNVEHFACNCSPDPSDSSLTDENKRLRSCQSSNLCKIASPGDRRVATALWYATGYNRLTESGIKKSDGLPTDGSNSLLFFQPEVTNDSRFGNLRGERTARWDLATDLPRAITATTGTYPTMLWAYTSTNTSGATTPSALTNDYALTQASRGLGGKTTFGVPLVPISRIPWYEWVMGAGAHRAVGGETLVPIRQTTSTGTPIAESVRVFAFGSAGTQDVSARFTSALREQLARIEDGTVLLASPAGNARAVTTDTAIRAVTIRKSDGAVTGLVRLGADGVLTWTAKTDATPLGGTATAVMFDPETRVLSAVVDNKFVTRVWTGEAFGEATVVGTGYEGARGIFKLADGYRLVTAKTGKLYIIDVGPDGTPHERERWNTDPGIETWVSAGRNGEVLIACRVPNGHAGVLVYRNGVTRGAKVDAVSGPALADAGGSGMVMSDPRDGTSPPTVATYGSDAWLDEAAVAAEILK